MEKTIGIYRFYYQASYIAFFSPTHTSFNAQNARLAFLIVSIAYF
jgi:hypothetical protein